MEQNGSNGSGAVSVWVDERFFLVVDGIKACRITPEGVLEFKDKNYARSLSRGTEFVYVTIEDIVNAIHAAPVALEAS